VGGGEGGGGGGGGRREEGGGEGEGGYKEREHGPRTLSIHTASSGVEASRGRTARRVGLRGSKRKREAERGWVMRS